MIICDNDAGNIYSVRGKASIHLQSGIKYQFEAWLLVIAPIVMNSGLHIYIYIKNDV